MMAERARCAGTRSDSLPERPDEKVPAKWLPARLSPIGTLTVVVGELGAENSG